MPQSRDRLVAQSDAVAQQVGESEQRLAVQHVRRRAVPDVGHHEPRIHVDRRRLIDRPTSRRRRRRAAAARRSAGLRRGVAAAGLGSSRRGRVGALRVNTGAETAIRYDTRCCFNVRSEVDMSQLNLQHGSDN